MRRFFILAVIFTFLIPLSVAAQEEEDQDVKTGFGFGGVPAVAYDSDLGFLYGVILNLYHYGDGSRYPRYDHSLYMEWSRTTKGTGKNILIYDSDRLIKGVRTSAEFSYYTEQGLDFYGFNGYKTYYNADFTDETHTDYLSRMFYKMDRKMLLVRTDFSGSLVGKKLKWFGGFEFRDMEMDTVDIDRLNKGKSDEDKLPYTNGGLFGRYAFEGDGYWGILDPDEVYGGTNSLIKLGVIYDTRDNEPNPMKGIWTEGNWRI